MNGICQQALLFGRAKRAARERASRLLSRASRVSTFHDIPQIEACSEAKTGVEITHEVVRLHSTYFSTNWLYGDEAFYSVF